MAVLNLNAIDRAPVGADPFEHVIVPGAVTSEALAAAHADFPEIDRPGSFPLASLSYGPGFAALVDALRGRDFAAALGPRLGIELEDKPTMITVRGQCRPTDGKIHRDSKGKLVTVLLYMNPAWESPGGQLRLLRNAEDIEDYVVEVPPAEGTLLAFPCTEDAWHGHQPFEGQRRTIQLNWVASRRYMLREQVRHSVSAFFKRVAA